MKRPTLDELEAALYRREAELTARERFQFAVDMNGDGRATISDVWLWTKWVFLLPGDAVLLSLMTFLPELGQFLELRPSSLSGWLSGLLSLALWYMALGLALSAANHVADHADKRRRMQQEREIEKAREQARLRRQEEGEAEERDRARANNRPAAPQVESEAEPTRYKHPALRELERWATGDWEELITSRRKNRGFETSGR